MIFTTSAASDQSGFAFTAVVELDTGEQVTVHTRRMTIASQVVDSACLERRLREDGRYRYRLAGQVKCGR